MKERTKGLRVTHVEGKMIGMAKEQAMFTMKIGSHKEVLTANIIPIGRHSLILGMPWLTHHNPLIDWKKREITFKKEEYEEIRPFEAGEAEIYKVNLPLGGDFKESIPKEYHDFVDVFDLEKARQLPPLRGEWDFNINLN